MILLYTKSKSKLKKMFGWGDGWGVGGWVGGGVGSKWCFFLL